MPADAYSRADRNVVYGMYSGTALLMDVFYPRQPNGYGIVFIPGSGWRAPVGYGQTPLKDNGQAALYAPSLLKAGYTVFVVTHRGTPTFHMPAPTQDAERAVRFVRHNASTYGIHAQRIGGYGGSSGAHLISWLGTIDGTGDPAASDPVDRESAKLQTIVARAAPLSLPRMAGSGGANAVEALTGVKVTETTSFNAPEYQRSWEWSPLKHVTRDDPPFLLIHGDNDKTVPFSQSEMMLAELTKLRIPAQLLRIPGGGHGDTFPGSINPPDYKAAMVRWFDQHLRRVSVNSR